MPADYRIRDETYSYAPSDRVSVSFNANDSVKTRGDKVMSALRDDLYFYRLRQIVSEGIVKKNSKLGKSKSDNVSKELMSKDIQHIISLLLCGG